MVSSDTYVILANKKVVSMMELTGRYVGTRKRIHPYVTVLSAIGKSDKLGRHDVTKNYLSPGLVTLYIVTLSNGSEVRSTLDQQFLMADGSYEQLRDIKVSDKLRAFGRPYSHRKNHTVISIESGPFGKSYGFEVDKTNNFALDAGVFISNSNM